MSSREGLRLDAENERGASARLRELLLAVAITLAARLCERLPVDRVVALGARIGRIWLKLSGPRVQRVREQLALAFPESDPDTREAWTREVFIHLGRGLAELLILGGARRAALVDRVVIEGLEHLEAAESASRTGGVLIVTGHCGNWELGFARFSELGKPLSVVYRQRRSGAADRALRALRSEGGAEAPSVEHTDAAEHVEQIMMGPKAGLRLARALEEGRKLLVLLDQNARASEGIFVSFFSRPACTRAGPIALAARRGHPVVPGFARRDPDGRTHRIRFHPALQLESGPSDDEEVLRRNVQRVTAAIEQEIRAAPGQWIWTHRRWRTQPPEVDDPAAV